MTERPNEAQRADESGAADGKDGTTEDGGGSNDPLTRRDVEAPRAPFQTSPTADE